VGIPGDRIKRVETYHNPPPVGKAGFEVWVLSKGGVVSVHHSRQFCTVVHVHLIGEVR
jgi:hypothetical protein